MKKIIVLILLAVAPMLALAQGTLYVSNLGDVPTGSAAVGSDSWIAQDFLTGTNSGGYVLNSIQLLMGASSGNPGGFTVSIYSYGQTGSSPGLKLGSLSGPDPSAGGVFTYSTSGIMLLPGVFYIVVVTADTPVAQGTYNWSAGPGIFQGGGTPGDEEWFISRLSHTSTDGLNWDYSRSRYFQMALYATPVPEPAAGVLLGLGLAGLGLWRRQNK